MSGAAADQSKNFPTMIIPRGTEIRVNTHGQLSIKTPGNLVIQNSGVYSEIESTNGSIRIEENITVEAVSIRAGEACFIQGTLTAWRVHAKRISLEDRARAFIMLQESEHLELARSARLVGNFSNEKELFLMMGKFSSQLKELPGGVDMGSHTPLDARPAIGAGSASSATASGTTAPAITPADEEHLRAAQHLLEREMTRAELMPPEIEALREVLFSLRDRHLQRIASVYRDAFAEVRTPSETLRQAYDHLERVFARAV